MVLLFAILSLFAHSAEAVKCDAKDTGGRKEMVERINRRYDDFFRYRRHLEEREAAREKGRNEDRKIAKQERDKKMEAARLEYIKNRRPKPDSAAAEEQAEEARKQRLKEMEAARLCYVQEKAQAEALLRRGRQIPGNQEFDLDQYE